MRRPVGLLTSACALAFAAGALSAPVFAQTATSSKSDKTSGETIETVVVTATKGQAQEIQKVPMAVQVFSGDELKAQNIETLRDLTSSIPGFVEGFHQSAASQIYNIRGAGATNNNGDSVVGYYLDDVPFIVTNFGVAPPVKFFDIDRIEVLRGPQGTLYGQGSSGGVFIFHTRDPNLQSLEYMGEVVGSQTNGSGNYNYELSGAVSFPVVEDTLAVRVSGGLSYNPGYADVYYGTAKGAAGPDKKNVNVVKNNDIRAVVLYKPLDNLTVRAQYWRFSPRQQYTGFLSGVVDPFYESTDGQPSYADGVFELMSATVVLDLEDVTITSATSRTTGHFGIYIPIAPAGPSFFTSEFYPSMLAEEIRAHSTGDGPLHWVVGGQYQDGQGPQKNELKITPYFYYVNADQNTLTQNYAGFGEVSYDLFDGKLVPLVGLREYHDDRAFQDSHGFQPTSKNVLTYRASLTYLPTDNLTIFGTTATGFRPGTVQSQAQVESLRLNGFVTASVALDPEYSTNYEIGARWRTDDRSLSVDLNFYLIKYTNMQTSATGYYSGVDGQINFGNATSKGIDYEIHWQTPVEGLALGLVGNLNGQVFDTVDPQLTHVSPQYAPGKRLVNSVLYNFRVDASYTTPITDEVSGYTNVSYSKTGNRYQGTSTADPWFGINATLGIRYDRWDLSLFGTNLTDERGPSILFGTNSYRDNLHGVTGPETVSGAIITPRTIGVRLRMNSQ
jgi:outer membrane receptor protein involved in Fe transport